MVFDVAFDPAPNDALPPASNRDDDEDDHTAGAEQPHWDGEAHDGHATALKRAKGILKTTTNASRVIIDPNPKLRTAEWVMPQGSVEGRRKEWEKLRVRLPHCPLIDHTHLYACVSSPRNAGGAMGSLAPIQGKGLSPVSAPATTARIASSSARAVMKDF